jgi:hypothetical protein
MQRVHHLAARRFTDGQLPGLTWPVLISGAFLFGRPNARSAFVKVKPPGGGTHGGFCLEIRQLGRIGVSGDWGYAGVRVEH